MMVKQEHGQRGDRMQDYKKKQKYVILDEEKPAIPWAKVLKALVGITALLILIYVIISLFRSEPETITTEIELPRKPQSSSQ